MITIRPVSDLRNKFTEIEDCVKSGKPVYLTKNGYGSMVVLSLEQYAALTDDIELNVCKTKHLTNTRSSSADEALKLTPPRILSLEEALDFIDTDELLEVTPKSLRIRKKILDPKLRKRSNFQ